jgi:RNA polymerase-binding transcription factor DksA
MYRDRAKAVRRPARSSTVKKATMLTPAEIETFRQQLMSQSRRHNASASELLDEAAHGLGGESGGGLSNAPLHLADLGNAQQEEEMDLALMENEELLLQECDAALARIEAGTFGRCEGCRRPIAKGRLQACPYVRYCVDCARSRENGQG